MCDYVILNLQESFRMLEEHLLVIEFIGLELDPASLNHIGEIGEIGWAMILDAFLLEDDDPPYFPPEGDVGLAGGSFEEVGAYPANSR